MQHPQYFMQASITTKCAGSGTVYFSSIRRAKGDPFEICEYLPVDFYAISQSSEITVRFKVICDDGAVADLSNELIMH